MRPGTNSAICASSTTVGGAAPAGPSRRTVRAGADTLMWCSASSDHAGTGGVRLDPALAAARVAYDDHPLDEADLADHPLAQFHRWYDDARSAGLPEPNAMVVATADTDGVPSARTVLLKQADERGFVLYTNYGSRKAAELARGHAALLFPWHAVHRQVAVKGLVERVPREESAAYFASRPWGSRIGAWASEQSRPVGGRGELEARWAGARRTVPGPRPARRRAAAGALGRLPRAAGRGGVLAGPAVAAARPARVPAVREPLAGGVPALTTRVPGGWSAASPDPAADGAGPREAGPAPSVRRVSSCRPPPGRR